MNFITSEEKAMLERQLSGLRALDKDLVQRIAEARAQGDLRENADYHAAREDKGLNDAKIRELEARLATAVVTGGAEVPEDMVFVGAMVRLRDVGNNDIDIYKLVGQASGRFDVEYIEVTVTSPMGEALLRARVGEIVRVDLPRGEKRFEIVEIVT
jgi:transcription elongation factor GreA